MPEGATRATSDDESLEDALRTTFALILPIAFVSICLLSSRSFVKRWLSALFNNNNKDGTKSIWSDIVSKQDLLADEEKDRIASAVVDDGAPLDERTPLLPQPRTKNLPRRGRPLLVLTAVVCIQASWCLGSIAYQATNGPGHAQTASVGFAVIWLFLLFKIACSGTCINPVETFLVVALSMFASIIELHATFLFAASAHSIVALRTASIVSLLLHLIAILAVCQLPLSPKSEACDIAPRPFSAHTSPEDDCTLGDWVSFNWISPLIRLASTQGFLDEERDIWRISRALRSRILARKYREICDSMPHSGLITHIVLANSRDMMIDLSLTIVSAALNYASPFFLRRILQAIEWQEEQRRPAAGITVWSALVGGQGGAGKEMAYLFAFFSFTCMILRSQTDLQRLYFSRRVCIRIRAELMSAVYMKGLRKKDSSGITEDARPSERSRKGNGEDDMKQKGIGAAVSLMASDAVRISLTANRISALWSGPVEILIAMTFLCNLLGPVSAFSGIFIVLLAIPLQTGLTRLSMSISRSISALLDRRMSATGELIVNLKTIRFSGWQKSFLDRILGFRDAELTGLWRRQLLTTATAALWAFVPNAVTVISFATYTLIEGKQLTVSTAFASLNILNLLTPPLITLPSILNELAISLVAVKRIEAFMNQEEVPNWVSSLSSSSGKSPPPPPPAAASSRSDSNEIRFEKANFKWPKAPPKLASFGKSATKAGTLQTIFAFMRSRKESSIKVPTGRQNGELPPFVLRDLTCTIPRGKITLISGPTASGKSSFLHAILGEMDLVEGERSLPKSAGNISFCAQDPWLQHASIRDNIVFGSPFDKQRYVAVLKACALLPDLAILPDGDSQEIGEGGIIMSGGQKARLALARSLYSHSEIVLLDDVLAACDAHVSRSLVRDALAGPLMEGRTLVIASHHVDLLAPYVAHVLKFDTGRIVERGPPDKVLGFVPDTKLETPSSLQQLATLSESEAEHVMTREKGLQAKTLFDREQRSRGRVRWEIYSVFLRNAGYHLVALVLLGCCAQKAAEVLNQFWLSIWAEGYNEDATSPPFGLPRAADDVRPYILGYSMVGLVITAVSAAVTMSAALAGNRAMRITFDGMLSSVMHATSRWLDTQPSGRIINRFSKDIAVIATSLPGNMRSVTTQAVGAVGSLVVLGSTLPTFLLPAIFFTWAYIHVAGRYNACSRELRRIESTTRSPIFTGYTETLRGIVTVRAFCAEERLLQQLFHDLDYTLGAFNLFWQSVRWLFLRFDVLGASSVLLATITALNGAVSPGLTAIAISQASSFSNNLFFTTRAYTQLEQDLTSMERAVDMLPPNIPAEVQPASAETPSAWPSAKAEIEFDGVVLRYAPDLPAVLKGVSLTVRAGERLGVCGRTGSGKSTLAMSLLRATAPLTEGSIRIEGVDLNDVRLETLRSRIGLVSQHPMLFSGTLRENLDPLGSFGDDACRAVLLQVRLLKPPAAAQEDEPTAASCELGSMIAEGGANLSAGQRQLLALARTILRKDRIVIADEATASLDFESDQHIQEVMRTAFTDCILITVGHRLSSIIDYDRIAVLDQGKLLECDTPARLLARDGSAFHTLCKNSGDYEELKRRALHTQIRNDSFAIENSQTV